MHSQTPDVQEYINSLPEERKPVINKLREVILNNLPSGFEETINYKMLGYVIPHSLYPNGYHCDPKLPLPFMNIASQKNFVAVYHMGIYSDDKLMNWFKTEYAKVCTRKLDMGKSCIRFKKLDEIPYDLIGLLSSRITPDAWIKIYETAITNK